MWLQHQISHKDGKKLKKKTTVRAGVKKKKFLQTFGCSIKFLMKEKKCKKSPKDQYYSQGWCQEQELSPDIRLRHQIPHENKFKKKLKKV